MDISSIFLHSFKRGNIIDSVKEREGVAKRLKLILLYSLVSHKYYQNYIKPMEGECYKQNWDNSTYGFSEDYISILDPHFICEKPIPGVSYREISLFTNLPSAYIIMKREWINKILIESRQKLNILNELDAKKKLLKNANEIDAIESSFMNLYLNPNDNLRQYEYVLPGEIKIRNQIPLEEICGLAFGKYILEGNKNIDMINQVLNDTNMQHLPVYLIENGGSCFETKNLTLTKI